MNNPPPEVTLRTLSSGSPIVDTGTLSAVWTISIDGQEVSRTTKPIINNGREAPASLLFSSSWDEPQRGGFITRSTIEDPTPLPEYMELFI